MFIKSSFSFLFLFWFFFLAAVSQRFLKQRRICNTLVFSKAFLDWEKCLLQTPVPAQFKWGGLFMSLCGLIHYWDYFPILTSFLVIISHRSANPEVAQSSSSVQINTQKFRCLSNCLHFSSLQNTSGGLSSSPSLCSHMPSRAKNAPVAFFRGAFACLCLVPCRTRGSWKGRWWVRPWGSSLPQSTGCPQKLWSDPVLCQRAASTKNLNPPKPHGK